jgi:predicted N-formylglutamate amidohydrolase
VIVTCEHGGNRVPPAYHALFRGHERLLASHRGWDPGALLAARGIAKALGAPLVFSRVTRLLVDLNRSPGHPALFSKVIAGCTAAERARIRARHYDPYRARVEEMMAGAIRSGRRVLHLSVHSFTPRLGGETRNADIGLLYDPMRERERQWCEALRRRLLALDPGLRVRRNYPYRGTADGFTTALRRRFPARSYAGIEIEISQKHAARPPAQWASLRRLIERAVRDTVRQ